MGHHINAAGQFQSDWHPDLPPDKIVLSFNDIHAHPALRMLAYYYKRVDADLSRDITARLETLKGKL